MSQLEVVEGTGRELLAHLQQFPQEHFRLVPLSLPSDKVEVQNLNAAKRKPSSLGNYAFVPGGSETFALEKQAEIERE